MLAGGKQGRKLVGEGEALSMRGKSLRLLAVASLVLTVLSGCDTGSGVNRTVRLNSLPAADEVEKALREVEGVERVEHRRAQDGGQPPYDQYLCHGKQFLYRENDFGAVVEIRPAGGTGGELRIYCLWINHSPPRAVIEQRRSLMDKLYEHLRRRLGELPPAEEVREELIRVRPE
jgi:hypothetical protein